jgi:hypothetical protein
MAEIQGVRLVAPSVVGVGEVFSLRVKLLTEPFFAKGACFRPSPGVDGRYNISPRGIVYMDNVPPHWRGTIAIEGGEGYDGPEELSFAEGPGPYQGDERPIRTVGGISFTTPGTRFISAVDPASGVRGVSNAIEVRAEAPGDRLFWGDIHSQTFFSDGLRCPEELYAFARHEGFLDIFALADHSEFLTDRQWEYFVGVTNDSYEPHHFATLVGLEWTSHRWGHRNVYYPGDSGPILRSTDPIFGELPNLFSAARQEKALVIPHHSANATMGVNWSLGHDPDVERLVEIHSVWGNSERSEASGNPRPIRVIGGEKPGQHVVDALAMGRRFGFIGGGDIHDGRPGDDLSRLQKGLEFYLNLHRQGIMGVWAEDLTREAVFKALYTRRVFATTNVRTILRFSLDGNPMGSEVIVGDRCRIVVEGASESPVASVCLVHNGEDLRVVEPNERRFHIELEESPAASAGYYYVRLVRADGEMAWSSPIWFSRS